MRALTILLVAHLVCVLAVPSGRSGAGRIHHPPKKPEGFVTGENLGLSGDEDAPSDSDSQPEGETDGDYEYESDEDDPEEESKSKIDGWTLKKHDAKKSVEGITLVATLNGAYPSWGDEFEDEKLNDGIKDYYNYNRAPLTDFELVKLKGMSSGVAHPKPMSEYRQWLDISAPDSAQLKAKEDLGFCENKHKEMSTKGLSRGEKENRYNTNGVGSWYHTEHVYEKQLVSKFFQEKIPDTHKLWFKEVAEDSLYNWDGLDDEKAEKLFGKNFYYVYNTKEWKGDKYLSCEKEFKAGRPCQKAVVPFKATNKGKDTLGQALAGVVGSNYRRDHLSLLEASLNSAKARIFARKVPHSGEKLRSYEKPQCIKNPTLLGTVPIPDEIIFKDRVQSLKQIMTVWDYFKEAENVKIFCSTSKEIKELFQKFDAVYGELHQSTDEDAKILAQAAFEKREKSISGLSENWKKGPGSKNFKLATMYEPWLRQYLKAAVKESHDNMVAHHGWFKPGGIFKNSQYFTAALDTGLNKRIAEYSDTTFWPTLETALEKEGCFPKKVVGA